MHLLPAEPRVTCSGWRRSGAAHPEVIIGTAGSAPGRPGSTRENGETVTTRHTLRELMDRLGELIKDLPCPGG